MAIAVKGGDLLTLFCKRCGVKFTWLANSSNETPPSYHSRSCNYRFNRRLRREGKRLPCPHPEKRVYPNNETAAIAARQVYKNDKKRGATVLTLVPYRCRCGAIHLGNVVKQEG